MVQRSEARQGGEGPRSVVGRYALYDQLASGGMATVHIGRLMGLAGFSRTVAIKRLHPHLAQNQDFVAMLLDEARLVVRVQHPNVVPVVDVVQDKNELLLVMEYVQGEPLNVLMRVTSDRGERMPQKMARAVIAGVLHGLHAAHESTDEKGEPLGIVHRDVSPQNVMIGIDGIARVLDFGIAKATGRLQMTRDGELKGKTPYMSPEQLRGEYVDRRTDVYAAAVLFWEMLTTKRLFRGQTQPEIAYKVLEEKVPVPSTVADDVPPELDAIVMKGLARDPNERFATALEMAIAIEELGDLATTRATGAWVEAKASDRLKERAAIIAAIESSSFQRASLSNLPVGAPVSGRPPANSDVAAPLDMPTIVEGARGRTTDSSLPPPAQSYPPVQPYAFVPPPAPSSMPSVTSSPSMSSMPSMPSMPSMQAIPESQRHPQSSMIALVAIALGTAVFSLAIAGWLLLHRAPPASPVATAAQPTGVPTPSVPASGAPSSVPSSTTSSAPSGTASAVTAATPSASASARPRGGGGGGGHPTNVAKPPKGACEPPYTLDSRGIRIPKPECL